MDLNALRMFVGVVQAGSLSAAAGRLGIPLPTLSRRVRDLERQLAVQLLERSVRGTRLTEAGMRLYENASRGVEMLHEAEQALVSDQARLKGRLRLSLPPGFEPWWELLGLFQRRYPEIRVQVFTTERRIDLIEDGVDVALRVGAVAHETMVARRLLAYRHVLVASPRLLEREGLAETLDDLRRFPAGVWSPGGSGEGAWSLGGQPVKPRVVLATNDYAHLRARALAAELVAELPPFMAAAAVRAGELVELLPRSPLPEQEIHLLYPSHRHPSTLVRTYLDFCQQHLDLLREACGLDEPPPAEG
ncbi:LysR family transcriptional regulator [Pseudomonas paraeruginosa]|uniref:LysR family transcriptional regulator n=1 Tax=Pseudomonas paraeruginosa TaxID=2994495 RepID=UPI0039FD0CBF